MALADELTALTTARPKTGGTRCRVATTLDSMSVEDGEALTRLIDGTEVYASAISATLDRNGYRLTAGQINHHRRRLRGSGCSCPRPDEDA
jgi:hypothetical protein